MRSRFQTFLPARWEGHPASAFAFAQSGRASSVQALILSFYLHSNTTPSVDSEVAGSKRRITLDLTVVVGLNIRRLRRVKRLTQAQLAAAAGLDLKNLGSIERGQGNPTVEVLQRLSEALGVHPNRFFADS